MKPCSNPGCDQPGTSSCSACKTTFYCGVICQTADWPKHKEECHGHLRKVGMANLAKAQGFHGSNWVQALRYAEIAATKLKQLKDRRLETVLAIDIALSTKFDALQFLDRHREAMECAKERYTLWAMNHMRNSGSIKAAFGLIRSCLHNNEYEDAEHFARHAMFMINDMTDSFIPSDERPYFLADGSRYLALAIYHLASNGGIPPEGKQKAGEEAIVLAREALEIRTQLHGTECIDVAGDMTVLADVLDYFRNVDDDEVLRLYEQSIAIFSRVHGSSSPNVGVGERKSGSVYRSRANRALDANDLDRCMANLELALPHYREAARIDRAVNRVVSADRNLQIVSDIEGTIRELGIARTIAATAAAAAATRG